jgi:transposase-like protein
VACPQCGGADPYRLDTTKKGKHPARKGLWKRRACRKQFTVKVGTIFEQSHIPVSKWLIALHLMASSKKGMSAHQLHRMLGMTYRSARFVAHRLRHAMADDGSVQSTGVVEMDETYVGGKRKNSKRGRPGADSHKAPVVALVQRGGKVKMFPVERVTSATLKAALTAHVTKDSTIMTDEYASYPRAVEGYAKHETVNHSEGEYVRGNAHTNSAEGVYSLLKRGINGTFHHVSKGHLHRYCDEFGFRHNHRTALGITDGERAAAIVLAGEGKRLTFNQLSGRSAA